MGKSTNKKYGKTVKRAGVNKLKAKYNKAVAVAIEQESYERRKMKFTPEFERKFPNIFETNE